MLSGQQVPSKGHLLAVMQGSHSFSSPAGSQAVNSPLRARPGSWSGSVAYELGD